MADHYLLLSISDDNLELSIRKAYKYFEQLVYDNKEGIVIKPDIMVPKDQDGNFIAPMFKVRNNNYLQMIYGLR